MEKKLLKPLSPGYYQALKDEKAKERYKAKLEFVSGSDPYSDTLTEVGGADGAGGIAIHFNRT